MNLDPNEKWNARWLSTAALISTWSKDPSTRVGCVFVRQRQMLSHGFNGFPRGVFDGVERYNSRELKYKLTVHAEVNCIAFAAKRGICINGCIVYLTHPCCGDCAKQLIQVGVQAIIIPEYVLNAAGTRYVPLYDVRTACDLFDEVGVPYSYGAAWNDFGSGQYKEGV